MTQLHCHWITSCALITWWSERPAFNNWCSGIQQLQFNSEIGRTNQSIRTMGPTHAETSQTHYQHNDEASYYISEVDLQKLPYMDWFVCHWFVLHSKISFNTVKIQLIHSTPCATFFRIVSLTFSFFPLFENFNYHIYLKNMYIKRLFSPNKIEEPFTFPQTS